MNWFSQAKRVNFFDIEPFASNDSSTMLLFHVFKDTNNNFKYNIFYP